MIIGTATMILTIAALLDLLNTDTVSSDAVRAVMVM